MSFLKWLLSIVILNIVWKSSMREPMKTMIGIDDNYSNLSYTDLKLLEEEREHTSTINFIYNSSITIEPNQRHLVIGHVVNIQVVVR